MTTSTTTTEGTNKDNATSDSKFFDCVVTFTGPQEGVMRVRAKSIEEAKEIILKQLSNRENVVIADVYDAMQAEMDMARQYQQMQAALNEQEDAGSQIPTHLAIQDTKLAN